LGIFQNPNPTGGMQSWFIMVSSNDGERFWMFPEEIKPGKEQAVLPSEPDSFKLLAESDTPFFGESS
jgi:hypothetical protein